LDLGIDSLGRIELASGLEKVINIKIKDEVIGKSFTVKDLILNVEAIIPASGYREDISAKEDALNFDSNYWRKLLEVLPDKENMDKIDIKPSFFANTIYNAISTSVFLFFKIFYGLKVIDVKNTPREGPLIIYANHSSYYDGFLIISSLPLYAKRNIFLLGFKKYFDLPIIRHLLKIGRIVPIDYYSHFTEALRSSYYIIKNGKNICLFPEGHLSLNGSVQNFKKGFAILAKETGAKLLPVCIEGAIHAWHRSWRFPKLHRIKVTVGKVLDLKELESIGRSVGAKDIYEAISKGAREELLKLRQEQ